MCNVTEGLQSYRKTNTSDSVLSSPSVDCVSTCVQCLGLCRPAPTGPPGSIGVHRTACMAAVERQLVLKHADVSNSMEPVDGCI